MQRLAILVPRRRLNLILFHGILALNAKHSSEIIPGAQKIEKNTSDTQDDTPHSLASVRISWARLLKRVFNIDIEYCPHCGGELNNIDVIQDPGSIFVPCCGTPVTFSSVILYAGKTVTTDTSCYQYG